MIFFTDMKPHHAERKLSPMADHDHARRLRNGIISLTLLMAIIVAALIAVPGLADVEQRLRQADGLLIAIAVVVEIASCTGYVLAFQLVFARAPRVFAARVAWAEMAFGSALSVGGAASMAVGYWLLHSRGVPAGRIAQRSAVLFLLTSAVNLIMLVLVGVLLGLGVVDGPSNPLLSWVPAAVGVVVFVGFMALGRFAERLARHVDGGRTAKLLLGLASSVHDTERQLVSFNWRMLGPVMYLVLDIACLWLCFRALGHAPPIASIVLAYQIGYLANVVPVPGGVGTLDTGLIGMCVVYKIRATYATAAVLAYHAISLWVPIVFGTIAFVRVRATLDEPLRPRPDELLRPRPAE
jgi:uncharacterized membrane protein YbhN (UPF0104 family)